MRGPRKVAVAVQTSTGLVVDTTEVRPWTSVCSLLGWPLVRGTVVLLEALVLGTRALALSAQLASQGEEGELRSWEVGLAVFLAFLLGLALFVYVPAFLGHSLGGARSVWVQNLVEGGSRLAIFLLYLFLLSRWGEMRRVFAYHGAEHKVINTLEEGAALTVEEADRRSPFHPSCGTTFLLVVVVVSIFAFALLGRGPWWWQLSARLLLLPLVAGISYEVIRGARRHRRLLGFLAAPGLWLQRLTTREPDALQLAVALAALEAVLEGGEADAREA